MDRLERRVREAAEAVLAEKDFVAPIDVLVGLGWMPPTRVDQWRQGRVEYLERVTEANLSKISSAMRHFRRWARDRDLVASETAYIARTRDRRTLRFSKSGDPTIERAYRTHWMSTALPKKRHKLASQVSKPPELVVIWPLQEWTCAGCGGTGSLLLMDDPGALCMDCAGLGHLEYLPAGDAKVTRRAKKASSMSAVVVRFSRSRRRYERQGILAEPAAIEEARRAGERP